MQNDSTEFASASTQREALFIDSLVDAKPDEIRLSAQGLLRFKEINVARLTRGRSLLEPRIQILLEGEQRDAAAAPLERVLGAKLNELWKPLRLERDSLAESDNVLLRSIGEQMKDGLGSLRVRQVQGLVRALQKSGRAALSESHIVVGRRHIFAPRAIADAAIVTRYALITAFKGTDAPLSWKPSPVHLLDKSGGVAHLSGTELERMGYERLQGRAVRVDIIERIVDPRFVQKHAVYLPTLMHTLRCNEKEAQEAARQLGLAGAPKGNRPRRR